MNNSTNWEGDNYGEVQMPEESFGWCQRPSCKLRKETWLANNLCQKCWDKSMKPNQYKKTSALTPVVLEVNMSLTEQIIYANLQGGLTNVEPSSKLGVKVEVA